MEINISIPESSREILLIFKINHTTSKGVLSAGSIYMSFRKNYDEIQQGMDWLILNNYIKEHEYKEGFYCLTELGFGTISL